METDSGKGGQFRYRQDRRGFARDRVQTGARGLREDSQKSSPLEQNTHRHGADGRTVQSHRRIAQSDRAGSVPQGLPITPLPGAWGARSSDAKCRKCRTNRGVFFMSLTEVMNIGLMQGFAGLSLFSVLLLMGLGLAIIFGKMGIINMAHGEFMTIGAYTIFLFSHVAQNYLPWLAQSYFVIGILVAFVLAFCVGWVTEWALIRHLYKRPLDTLLATWGVSLGMQQLFRSTFSAKEVSATLPNWLMGSWAPATGLDIPINGMFVMVLTAVGSGGLMLGPFLPPPGRAGRRTPAHVPQSHAPRIHT